jgi:hypothetical protein
MTQVLKSQSQCRYKIKTIKLNEIKLNELLILEYSSVIIITSNCSYNYNYCRKKIMDIHKHHTEPSRK